MNERLSLDRPAPERLPLVRLMTLLSPTFPIGAFAYSHGLETAIARRQVADRAGLVEWIETLLHHGSGWNDLVLLQAGFGAATLGEEGDIAELCELGIAVGGTLERRAETIALGRAFLTAAAPWCGDEAVGEGLAHPYPVAVGRVAALARISAGDALAAYAHGFAANLVSVATRLVPLGQFEAMRALHALEGAVTGAASRAERATLDDLGSCALLSDIAAMAHETLDVRLFRS